MRTRKEMAAAGQRQAQPVHQRSQTWDRPGSAPDEQQPPHSGATDITESQI